MRANRERRRRRKGWFLPVEVPVVVKVVLLRDVLHVVGPAKLLALVYGLVPPDGEAVIHEPGDQLSAREAGLEQLAAEPRLAVGDKVEVVEKLLQQFRDVVRNGLTDRPNLFIAETSRSRQRAGDSSRVSSRQANRLRANRELKKKKNEERRTKNKERRTKNEERRTNLCSVKIEVLNFVHVAPDELAHSVRHGGLGYGERRSALDGEKRRQTEQLGGRCREHKHDYSGPCKVALEGRGNS